MLKPGTILQGRYKVEKLLGQGGMGEVYQAIHVRLGVRCALKTMHLQPADPAERLRLRQLFEREARILAALDHPNLTRVTDFFEEAEAAFIVMEHVEGTDLGRALGKPLPEAKVLTVAARVLDALEYLHSRRPPVIVRDLKPENLILGRDSRIRLIDFGIAKLLNKGATTATLVRKTGSPGFSPLEQYGEGGTDERTDLYALGATLLCLLCGKVPPDAVDRVTRNVPLPDPRPSNPVSDRTWSALQKLLALSPDDRPRSAAQARKLLFGNAPPPSGSLRLASSKGRGAGAVPPSGSSPPTAGPPPTVAEKRTVVLPLTLSSLGNLYVRDTAAESHEWTAFTPGAGPVAAPPGHALRLRCSTSVTDEGLAQLEKLPMLQSLSLADCKSITDAGLAHLKSLRSLRELNLKWTSISDQGLAWLEGLASLQELDLDCCFGITDAGLQHLKRLRGLRRLFLHAEGLTDAGLAQLKGLTALESLSLTEGVNITDVGLQSLKGLVTLESLFLNCRRITDEGLRHLQGLAALEDLSLSDCENLSDAGLRHLLGLTSLEDLDLSGCARLTDAGIAHLKGLPGLQRVILVDCKGITAAGVESLKGGTSLKVIQ